MRRPARSPALAGVRGLDGTGIALLARERMRAAGGQLPVRRETGCAGGVDFQDAPAPDQTLPAQNTPPPFWQKFDTDQVTGRLTGITASVAIQRRTRTAARQKLFHVEFVPPGVKFDVSLLAHNVSPEHMGLLLATLDQFNEPSDRLQLGAKTGNGWGQLTWTLGGVRKMIRDDVKKWLATKPILPSIREDLAAVPACSVPPQSLPADRAEVIRLRLTLHFDGPFLVKRPMPPKTKGTEEPNAVPYLDERGRVVLPASSFRGVLRSQAERILRTLAPDDATAVRWAPDPSAKEIEAVREGNLRALSLVARAFGATGGAMQAWITGRPAFAPWCCATCNKVTSPSASVPAKATANVPAWNSTGFRLRPRRSPVSKRPSRRVSLPPSPEAMPYHPYHFVPVDQISHPAGITLDAFDRGQVPHLTHDRYLSEREGQRYFSGRIICNLESISPLVIGASHDKRQQPALVKPFKLPDGQPAIPASTLRGLFSSLAEAASNSALRILALHAPAAARRPNDPVFRPNPVSPPMASPPTSSPTSAWTCFRWGCEHPR